MIKKISKWLLHKLSDISLSQNKFSVVQSGHTHTPVLSSFSTVLSNPCTLILHTHTPAPPTDPPTHTHTLKHTLRQTAACTGCILHLILPLWSGVPASPVQGAPRWTVSSHRHCWQASPPQPERKEKPLSAVRVE